MREPKARKRASAQTALDQAIGKLKAGEVRVGGLARVKASRCILFVNSVVRQNKWQSLSLRRSTLELRRKAVSHIRSMAAGGCDNVLRNVCGSMIVSQALATFGTSLAKDETVGKLSLPLDLGLLRGLMQNTYHVF